MATKLPLLAGQASIWAAEQLGTVGLPYNLVTSVSYDRDEVSPDHLTATLDGLIDTNRCLHARVVDERGVPEQVLDTPPAVVRRQLTSDDPTEIRAEMHEHRFDVAVGPLHVFQIVTSPSRVHLVSCQHHVVWDGMSRGLFVEDLAAAVRGTSSVHPAPYAEVVEASLELERAAIADGPDGIVDRLAAAAPTDLPSPSEGEHASANRTSREVRAASQRLQDAGGSAAGLVVAGAASALRPAGDAPRLLGFVVTTRPRHLRSMGCFVNTVPIVVGPDTVDLAVATAAVHDAVQDRHLPLRVVSTAARRAGVGFSVDERFVASMSVAHSPDDVRVDLPRGNRSSGITFRYWEVNDDVVVGLDHNLGLLSEEAAEAAADRLVDELTRLASEALTRD